MKEFCTFVLVAVPSVVLYIWLTFKVKNYINTLRGKYTFRFRDLIELDTYRREK